MSISEVSNESEFENTNKKSNKIAKYKRKTYTIMQKIKIVNELNISTIHELGKKYGISRKNIRRWREQREELEKVNFKKVKNNLSGSGQPPQTLDIENDLESFIKKTVK